MPMRPGHRARGSVDTHPGQCDDAPAPESRWGGEARNRKENHMWGALRAIGDRLSSAHAIAVVALVIALGGGAYAATSGGGIPGPGGVINSCYGKTTGQLRVVGANKRCNRSS